MWRVTLLAVRRVCSFPRVIGGAALQRVFFGWLACVACACTVNPPQGVFVCASDGDCPDGQACFARRCWRTAPQDSRSNAVSEPTWMPVARAGAEAPAAPPTAPGAPAAASCSDGLKNQNESDVDCGGACPACHDGLACSNAVECTSAVCEAGKCASASCTDRTHNGTESDLDCGGPCGKCAAGKHCASASDCESARCVEQVCTAASCTDHEKNASETDVDCGGPACPPCADGRACVMASDCQSAVCQVTCQAATCSDHVKNGVETGVDCGGSCPACVSVADCKVNYEIKVDAQTTSGWFGGDSRPQSMPRSEGTGTSVLVHQAGTLKRFAFYFTSTFRDGAGMPRDVTLVLQIRDGAGKVQQTARVNVPASFREGYVFWENLGAALAANTRYIFTSYMLDALSVGAWSGYAGDAAQGYAEGQGYTGTVTDADATFDDWSTWQEHNWDRRFWLQACP